MIRTTQAFRVGDHYMVGTAAEFWEETNGIDGLQRTTSRCSDGQASIPPDRCITHTENNALVACASSYPATLVP